MAKQPKSEVQTIVIDNFSGALTRIINGPMNSGLARYETSYGYNPFIEPHNLTWLPSISDITGSMSGVPCSGQTRVESGVLYLYLITDGGNVYKVNTDDDSFSLLVALSTGTPTWNYGASRYI